MATHLHPRLWFPGSYDSLNVLPARGSFFPIEVPTHSCFRASPPAALSGTRLFSSFSSSVLSSETFLDHPH